MSSFTADCNFAASKVVRCLMPPITPFLPLLPPFYRPLLIATMSGQSLLPPCYSTAQYPSAYSPITRQFSSVTHNVFCSSFLWVHATSGMYSDCCRFCARQHNAIARICDRNSVCLDVCLSHGWIVQKRLKLGSCNLHHRVAP